MERNFIINAYYYNYKIYNSHWAACKILHHVMLQDLKCFIAFNVKLIDVTLLQAC